MTVSCSNCGASCSTNSKYCPVCGSALPASLPPALVGPGPKRLDPTMLMSSAAAGGEIVMADGQRLSLISPTTIGRDEDQCQVALSNDTQVSRLHARLEESGGNWLLTDLGSSNGTFVNGVRIHTPTLVSPGDQIVVGGTTFALDLPRVRLVSNLPVPVQPAPMTPAGSAAQSPRGGWRLWKKQPVAEGYVQHISERYMVKKDDLFKKGFAAAALGLFISPALAFLPFIQGNEIPGRDMRIEDYRSGQLVDVKALGEITGNINLGDAIAVWGPAKGGVVLMQTAYNYETDTSFQIKKK
jgi:hypothetical protein